MCWLEEKIFKKQTPAPKNFGTGVDFCLTDFYKNDIIKIWW